jgi:hypothetical protein
MATKKRRDGQGQARNVFQLIGFDPTGEVEDLPIKLAPMNFETMRDGPVVAAPGAV